MLVASFRIRIVDYNCIMFTSSINVAFTAIDPVTLSLNRIVESSMM